MPDADGERKERYKVEVEGPYGKHENVLVRADDPDEAFWLAEEQAEFDRGEAAHAVHLKTNEWHYPE